MPQSLSNVLVHVVFSTKHRRPFLRLPEHRDTIAGYVVGILKNIHCPSLIIGGTEDHVHLLCNLHRTIAVAQLVEEVKTGSSGASRRRDWTCGISIGRMGMARSPSASRM